MIIGRQPTSQTDDTATPSVGGQAYTHPQIISDTVVESGEITGSAPPLPAGPVAVVKSPPRSLEMREIDKALYHLSVARMQGLDVVARSNAFDDWRRVIRDSAGAPRAWTGNHRQVLGLVLLAVGRKDIIDVHKGLMEGLQRATVYLRYPRITDDEVAAIDRCLEGDTAWVHLSDGQADDGSDEYLRLLIERAEGAS